ncbi:MAG: hypothetical protein J0L92_18100 [Deltaproteobacteria bacterium]|nr:hypothetical protein [Deltaproteobacteria bacterium]
MRSTPELLVAASFAVTLAACGGASPTATTTTESASSTDTATPTETGSDSAPTPDTSTASAETESATDTAPPVSTLPALTANDPHTRVVGQVEGACAVDGVDRGSLYVGVSGRTSMLVRMPLAGGASEVVHRAEGALDYRVASGTAAYLQNTEGFGISNFGVVPLDGGEALEIAHGVRQSTWVLAAGGVYYADPSYSEPRVLRIGLGGGAPTEIEELRPVFDEDRLEQMIASNGELVFVAVRTRDASRGGYFCHELRGGPAGVSQTLRRYRRCPSDDEILDAISVSQAFVYYHRAEGLYRVPRHGSGREETVIADVRGLPTATLSDDRFLVWPQREGLLRLSLNGRAVPEVIGERAQTLSAPILVDGVVYWARRDAGQCVVLARPIDAPALSPWEPT